MCNCMDEITERLKEKMGYEYVGAPVEMLSGRTFITFYCKEPGKKKDKEMPMLLSRCPFCGEKYPDEDNLEN